MKKLVAAMAITLTPILTTSAMADFADGELTYFVGGEVGKTWIKTKGDVTLPITNFNIEGEAKYKDPMQYGVRFGAYANDDVRVYVNFNQLSGSNDTIGPKTRPGTYISGGVAYTGSMSATLKPKITNRQLTVSADYLFNFGAPVKPFIGATIGANWTEVKLEAESKWAFSDGGTNSKSGFEKIDETKSATAFAYGGQAGILGQLGEFDVELGYRYLEHKNDLEFGKTKLKTDKSQSAYLAISYKF